MAFIFRRKHVQIQVYKKRTGALRAVGGGEQCVLLNANCALNVIIVRLQRCERNQVLARYFPASSAQLYYMAVTRLSHFPETVLLVRLKRQKDLKQEENSS